MKLSEAAATGACDAVADLCDDGSVVIYTGSEPTHADDAAATEVATCVLSTPAFGAASYVAGDYAAEAALATAAVDPDCTGSASAVTHFRVLASNSDTVLQGTCSPTTGDDLVLATDTISAGSKFVVTNLLLAASIESPAPPPPGGNIALSASHADIGDEVTITGTGFGAAQGTSTVTFGEPVNIQGWAPVTKEAASYVSWSNTSITCTVPAMSPGKAGYPDTYHRVRVYVGGVESNAADFYIDPVTTITTGTSTAVAYSVIAQTGSEWGEPSNATWDPATATYTSSTIFGLYPVNNADDILFDGVTFTATCQTMTGTAWGVLSLGNGEKRHERMTFLNCTFSNNTGVGEGVDFGVNCVKVATGYNVNDLVNDLTFADCLFGTPDGGANAFTRMGYEQQNGAYGPATRIKFTGCTFEPAMAEPLSLNAGDNMHLYENCLFKGGGGGTPEWGQQYSNVFESNQGHYIEIRDCEFWRWSGTCFNFNGDNDDPHILVTGGTVDFSHAYQTDTSVDTSCVFGWASIDSVRVAGVAINTGTDGGCCDSIEAYGANYFYSCEDNDFSGSTVTGYVRQGGSAFVPETGTLYWRAGSELIAHSNVPPTKV